MNEDQIREMISHIVGEIDYDYWKEMFVEDCTDKEDQKDRQDTLIKIVQSHLNKA